MIKYNSYDDEGSKGGNSSYNFPTLRQNDDLFDEEDNVVHKLISVKRVALPKNGEDWEIREDDKVVFLLRGVRLTKKERALLKTPEGILALMDEYKQGSRSVNKIKNRLKKILKGKK